jgi:hypothetical protein
LAPGRVCEDEGLAMGRVKIPRCDNCGAPVEFAPGAHEARCEYCAEVLIRELPAPARPRTQPQAVDARYVPASASHHPRTKLWPLLVVIGATVAIAGASAIATFAGNLKPLPNPAVEVRANVPALSEVRTETESFSRRADEKRSEVSAAATATGARTSRPRSAAPKTSAAPTSVPKPADPPKPPRFDSEAAVAGLDAAKAKAEASCKSTTVKSLFVQMGFDADGKNRGAALSDPKHNGTPEAKCVLTIFRSVRIPAFDPTTRPSGLGRMVRL